MPVDIVCNTFKKRRMRKQVHLSYSTIVNTVPQQKKTTNKSCIHINTLHAYPRINYVEMLFALCLCFFIVQYTVYLG